MFKDKRGQGLSVNAIILIVLGVLVLVMLIVGFTVGWSKIVPFISTNNVGNVVSSCELACSTQSQFDYCTSKRNLNADDVELTGVTCNYLAQEQSIYGVTVCPGITCEGYNYAVSSAEEAAEECRNGNEGVTYQYLEEGELQTFNCPEDLTNSS